jgi:alpha-glucosidase
VSSPNGLVSFSLTTDVGRLIYSVFLARDVVVEPSSLGIVVDGKNLGDGVEIGRAEAYDVDETYPWYGAHETAVSRCRGSRVTILKERGARGSSPSARGQDERATAVAPTRVAREGGQAGAWTVDIRACDDGAAFRYIVPGGARDSRTPDEATTFRWPVGSTVWSHDFEGHYEGVHVRRDVDSVSAGDWVAPPLTVKLAGAAGYASVTESSVAGYAGLALRADGRRGFLARLGHEEPVSYPYRLRYKPEDIARLARPAAIAGTIRSPWRLVIAGRTLNALVNADIVHNLAPPPDRTVVAATGWIKPGRAVWRFLDGGENTFEGVKAFTRLAQQLGFEYHVVEGLWQRWTDEQMRDFMADAKTRHVGIWLWKDSRALTTVEEQRAFFDTCRELGVVGAKIDFFDHEAKEMIDRYQSILRESAARRIMVNFHGANKPAGEARTWPHELTREGVYGLEHRQTAEWSRHNTTLPFTRYLAGAADYTPVVFGERRKDTSWAHQIATAAVFTSPLLVFGAHPQGLLDSPAVDLIKSLPSTWDETVVLLSSEIGELAAFARRKGTIWYIAVLNGPTARTLRIDLGFLGKGRYDALVVRDNADDPAAVTVAKETASAATRLVADLRAAGGFIARLTSQGPQP